MTNEKYEYSGLELFPAGVPPGAIVQMAVEDLRAIASLGPQLGRYGQHGRALELCFIGGLCYFEAFCKDQVASILNIRPVLIRRLGEAGFEIAVDPAGILELPQQSVHSIGFLVAERLNCGTAKSINRVFECLVEMTPFSSAARRRHEQMIADRNLLVHHGGVFNTRYGALPRVPEEERPRLFMDSLVISQEQLIESIDFLARVARSIVVRSAENLWAAPAGSASSEIDSALRLIDWWDEGNS